jgi:hypothetical protein
MKFTLILFLCSFINNECLPPQEIKQHYNSWKECTLAALEISTEIMLLQEEKFVNKNKVATKMSRNSTIFDLYNRLLGTKLAWVIITTSGYLMM